MGTLRWLVWTVGDESALTVVCPPVMFDEQCWRWGSPMMPAFMDGADDSYIP